MRHSPRNVITTARPSGNNPYHVRLVPLRCVDSMPWRSQTRITPQPIKWSDKSASRPRLARRGDVGGRSAQKCSMPATPKPDASGAVGGFTNGCRTTESLHGPGVSGCREGGIKSTCRTIVALTTPPHGVKLIDNAMCCRLMRDGKEEKMRNEPCDLMGRAAAQPGGRRPSVRRTRRTPGW